jgi:hypothetical protein
VACACSRSFGRREESRWRCEDSRCYDYAAREARVTRSMTLIRWRIVCDIDRQNSSAPCRDDLLPGIQTVLHSPRKVVERALIARVVMVAALGWMIVLERLDSRRRRFFAFDEEINARDGEYVICYKLRREEDVKEMVCKSA